MDTEELKLGVDDVDGVNVPVFEPEPVWVTLGVSVGVPEVLRLTVVDIVDVNVSEFEGEGVFVTVSLPVFVALGVSEAEAHIPSLPDTRTSSKRIVPPVAEAP